MGGSLVQMVLGLVVVLAAIAGSAWFARRMGVGSGQGARVMKIVSALPVGPKERVVIVEVEGQWMVLGVAPGRVSALTTLPRGSVATAPVNPAGVQSGVDFASLLRKAVGRA